MKITIIVPVFNGEKFVENAYRQILKQEVPHFEIIFVDNNSTDGSLALLREIERQDKRVVVIKETIQGAAAARNKGLRYGNGDYIFFFDVDDELFPNSLKVLLKVLEDHDTIDSVFGNHIKTNKHIGDITIPYESLEITIRPTPYWGVRWLDYSTLPGTPSFLHRKRVFEKIGMFNTALLLGEDAAFLVKLGMECNIVHIDKYVMLYHRHKDSTVSKQNKIQPDKVFTYWEPLVHDHIPYYTTTKTPLEFRKKLLFKVYGSVAKMIALTNGYKDRRELKETLLTQIKPLKFPCWHRPFLSVIVMSGSIHFYKVYLFYVVRPYLRYCSK